MPFPLKCNACAQLLQVKEEWAGKQVKCPRCAAVLSVPVASVAPAAPVAPAPIPPPPPPAREALASHARADAEGIPEGARGLGELRGEYGFSRWMLILSYAVGVVAILVGCAIPFLVLFIPTKDGARGSLLGGIIGGAAFALVGAVLILYARYLNSWRILLFRDGFAYAGSKTCRTVRWDEVTTYWDYLRTFRVDLKDGQSVKVSVRYCDDAADVRDHVEEQVSARLFPAALQHFRTGASLEFGPFTLTRDGLEYNGSRLPWGELKHFAIVYNPQIRSRSLEISREDQRRVFWSVSATKVPNLRLLHRLAQEARPGLG